MSHEESDGLIRVLAEALRRLYDEQNGPPLIRREAKWQAAMDQAGRLLKQVETQRLDVLTRLLAVYESMNTSLDEGKTVTEADIKNEQELMIRRKFVETKIALIKIQNGVLP